METFCYRRATGRDWESTQRTALAAAGNIGTGTLRHMPPGHRQRLASQADPTSKATPATSRLLRQILPTPATLPPGRIHLDLSGHGLASDAYRAYLRTPGRVPVSWPAARSTGQAKAFALAEVAWALALTGEHQRLSPLRPGTEDHEETRLPREGRAPVEQPWATPTTISGCRTEAALCYQRSVQIHDEFVFRYDKASR